MEKLIFRKLYSNITLFFLISIISISLIVWITQAINFLDLVSEDGHGLKIYFQFTLYNFPKILNKIILFIFFLSVFYVLSKYEEKNELLLFWINGIEKKNFASRIIKFSLFFLIIQVSLSTFIVPYTLNKAKSFVRKSNVDYLGSIISEKKFTDAIKGLTIFIEKKENNLLKNIYLKDEISKDAFQVVYAKEGEIINKNNLNLLILYNGRIINNEKGSINSFAFKKTKINLSEYISKTVLFPKIQEANLLDLIYCFQNTKYLKKFNLDLNKPKFIQCNKDYFDEIFREILKRLYLPIYIPLLALIASLLVIKSRDYWAYSRFKFLLFINGFLTISLSEISIRYAGSNLFTTTMFISLPLLLFYINYIYLSKNLKPKSL